MKPTLQILWTYCVENSRIFWCPHRPDFHVFYRFLNPPFNTRDMSFRLLWQNITALCKSRTQQQQQHTHKISLNKTLTSTSPYHRESVRNRPLNYDVFKRKYNLGYLLRRIICHLHASQCKRPRILEDNQTYVRASKFAQDKPLQQA